MLRWILLLVAATAFGMAFRTDSPGLLAATLLVGFVALLGSFFGFLSARVENVAQGQSVREVELLLASRKRRAGGGNDGAFAAASLGGLERDPDLGTDDGGGEGGDGGGGGGGSSGD